jgi:geranylgeranyl diphosphate synthase, type II
MDAARRIEQGLINALALADLPGCPPKLASAMRHAVFPGGARVRPRLVLAVAGACGDDVPQLTDAAATAIELLHCASLVHDDLPCFDDAATRRGKPSVHRAYGERLAVLSGDALIVLAFQVMASVASVRPERACALLFTVSRSVGLPRGIVAGQAWECESKVSLVEYQREKTGSLFEAAAVAGAEAAGAAAQPWREFGDKLGEAYQVADDIRDAAADPVLIGKPVGRDVALARPSSARELGLEGAVRYFERLVGAVVAAIPACPGEAVLRDLVAREADRLVPSEIMALAA